MRACAIAMLVGCYSPAPPAGAPCGEGDVCPSGQQCIAGFCGSSGGEIDAEVVTDASIDAPTCTTWTARHVQPCALPAPIGDLNLTDALSGFNWDTNNGELKGKMGTPILVTTMAMSQSGGPEVLLASVNNFTMEAGATLTIAGNRALLIAVNGTAQIDGDIIANALFGTPGPGGSGFTTAECPSDQTGNPGAPGMPATGGGGGGFQGSGGRGGNAGGVRGVGLTAPPTVIRGGCAGGGGGDGTLGAIAPRGAGGGAVVIDARVGIHIGAGGSINVGGGGGSSGRANYGGGGGGGSGGLIGLNASTITIAGTLAANGGGGGGGASDVGTGASGNSGAASGTAAAGGTGAGATNVGACGKGGNGSFGGTLDAEDGTTVSCGGGGGGGAAGFILFWSPTQTVTGTVSPPALSGP